MIEPVGMRAQLEDADRTLLHTHKGTQIVSLFSDLVYSSDLPSHRALTAMGRNPVVGATFEDVWAYGGLHTEITTAAAVYISSSALADTQTIEITGLDADWAIQTQQQALAGRTKTEVGTGLTWMRVFQARNVSAILPTGDVYCYLDDTLTAGVPDTPAKVQSKILIGSGQSLDGRYSVPAGYIGYVKSFSASISGAAASEIDLMYRPFGEGQYVIHPLDLYWNFAQVTFDIPLICTAKSDIWIRALANGGAVAGGFQGWYELS